MGVEALRAAVAGGADAVYLGVDKLNARRGAENFTMDALADACRFAHLRGVGVYLTANVVVLPAEMDEALEMSTRRGRSGSTRSSFRTSACSGRFERPCRTCASMARRRLNAHSSDTVEDAGVRGASSRVTLARETSARRDRDAGGAWAGRSVPRSSRSCTARSASATRDSACCPR